MTKRTSGSPRTPQVLDKVNRRTGIGVPVRAGKGQSACKPGSVWREVPFARDGHSSGTILADRLEQPTRATGLEIGWGLAAPVAPIRSCSRWGLPCRARCRPRGALLPHLFTLTCRAGDRRGGRFVFCGAIPGVTPAGRYPAPYFHGARTFLPTDLRRASGRPADWPQTDRVYAGVGQEKASTVTDDSDCRDSRSHCHARRGDGRALSCFDARHVRKRTLRLSLIVKISTRAGRR